MKNAKEVGNFISKFDPEIGNIINKELSRQQENLELIASENFTSQAVMTAMGSILTNKYAEGYPSKRYYGGCCFVDEIESIAINRAKKLFLAEHANVQPHSGSSANFGVYFALLNPGDTVLGMNLISGGHLTHGSDVNVSGKYFNFISYDVDEKTQLIDYEELHKLAIKTKPKMIVCGASAYSRIIDFKKFREISDEVSAYLMVDMAHIAGLVAAGVHPNPVPYSDVVTSTTHKTLRGPRSGLILCKKNLAKKIDSAIFPGTQGGPLMHVIAAKAICFKEASTKEFKIYVKNVVENCKELAKGFKKRGIKIVSDGTDNHLLLLDLKDMKITGKDLEKRLDEVRITVNKNTVPKETRGPFITSGIRIGTSAVTTRGMGKKEMQKISEFISLAIFDFENNKNDIRKKVKNMCSLFPLYKNNSLQENFYAKR